MFPAADPTRNYPCPYTKKGSAVSIADQRKAQAIASRRQSLKRTLREFEKLSD